MIVIVDCTRIASDLVEKIEFVLMPMIAGDERLCQFRQTPFSGGNVPIHKYERRLVYCRKSVCAFLSS